jgi:ribosomal protein S20
MAVAALSTAGFNQYIAASSNVTASNQALQTLQQSLAAGNLTAAQSAFNTYQQLNQSTTSANSQLGTDWKTLGSAISSGNLTNAQSAFATVQSDLKSTPSQSITNAEAAVAQTVQWVDDLLNLSTSSSGAETTSADPTTAILDAAYGQNAGSNSTDPTTSILNSAYGSSATGSTTGSTASAGATTPTPLSAGNLGSSASVNVYA